MADRSLSCLLCGETLTVAERGLFDTRFGIPGTWDSGYCPRCGTRQLMPLPDDVQLAELYQRYYNFGGERAGRYQRWRAWFLFSGWYRLWLALDGDVAFHSLRGTGRLLDVGCNEGRGLRFFQAHGFAAEGQELNPNAAAVARQAGFTVTTEPLSALPSATYDVVVLTNVLEHVTDPGAMLKELHRLLKPGGLLCLSTPNERSWQRRCFGHSWINWHIPFHLTLLNEIALRHGLVQAGFEQVSVRHQSPALWTALSLIAALRARPGHPTRAMRRPLLVALLLGLIRGLLFPVLWWGNHRGQGDCLVVQARRAAAPSAGGDACASSSAP